jgi:hypothetical protein
VLTSPPRGQGRAVFALAWAATLLVAAPASAQLVQAEPLSPIAPPFPVGAPPLETQVAVLVVVDANGGVESAVEASRAPRAAPDTFARAAVEAVKAAKFSPSLRDGRKVRSRIETIVVFHPPATGSSGEGPTPTAPPAEAPTPGAAPAQVPKGPETVEVRGISWSSLRGLGDIRVDREVLTASPRQHTSEMLSAAPGFFVDHEDGEGLGNDVYLRGFDLDNGSGIEMKVGEVPINVPLHIHGQGYADVNFIIPEVVRSIRVLEGPYDPRQGDSAIVGSAIFDLGMTERGYQLKTTYGSFNQARIVGIAAPKEASDETFAAFSLRETRGFGMDRASKSASVNAQYGLDLGDRDHLRVLATAYSASAALPGVVRQDDVNAGRIGYYDAYPFFNSTFPENCNSASCSEAAQGVASARVIVGAELDHVADGGAKFAVAPWVMWTHFLSRQNYTGNLNSSNLQPQVASLGDLWQLTNVETAGGVTARFHAAPVRIGEFLSAAIEPGVSVRAGHTDQTKDLVNPANLAPWDYRESFGLNTVDLAGYLDLDVRLWKKLRVSGGVRVDFLDVGITDNLSGVLPPVAPGAIHGSATVTNVAGVAPGPRVTVAYEAVPELMPVVSAGEGFRSLDAGSLILCNTQTVQPPGGAMNVSVPPCVPGSPYSQVTSFEAGFRSVAARGRFTTTLTAFQTNVANELVFEVASGGLETEAASTRRGILGSLVARPTSWLLVSTALSVQTATFDTLVAGTSHHVPNVPAVLWRTDVNAQGELLRIKGAPVTGRIGVGYTLLGGRHVNDAIIAPTNNIVNALASARYRFAELGFDMYNVLGLKYADDMQHFVSNWGFQPGQPPASPAVHIVAAPPRTALATLTLYF